MKKLFLLLLLFTGPISTYAQYCNSAANSSADGELFNVTLGALNNTTACGASLNGSSCVGIGTNQQYADFTVCGVLGTYLAGSTYPLSLSANTCGGIFNYGIKVYIDYNQNFSFTDPGEMVYLGPSATTGTPVPFVATGNVTIPITAAPGPTRMRVILWETNSPSTMIQPCANPPWGEVEDYLVSIIPPTPCSGQVDAGNISPDSILLCPTAGALLMPTGGSIMSDIDYQWLTSNNAGATWTAIPGATNPTLQIPPGSSTAWYALSVICLNNFSLDTTNMVYVNVSQPIPATIPYVQDFESWVSFCDNKDVPGYEWLNTPSTGNNSWRRNDEGFTANWTNQAFGNYVPASTSGNHSARFHNYAGTGIGDLDLYLDLSSSLGTKTVFFDYNNASFSTPLTVRGSANGAAGPFTTIQTFTPNSGVWTTHTLAITSNSPNYVLRFEVDGVGFDDDIGIDNLMVAGPCGSTVNAGTINDSSVCSGKPFLLKTVGSTLAGGLSYNWQVSSSPGGPWTSIGTSINNTFLNTAGITTPSYFRVVVTCTATGATSTSSVGYYTLREFYYCYCGAAPTSAFDDFDIGNFTLEADTNGSPNFGMIINNVPLTPTDTYSNANATKTYTQFWNLPIQKVFRDSSYRMSVTNINQTATPPYGASVLYIDYNRNGIFDPNELASGGNILNSKVQSFFTVPSNASTGITGMRVISISNQPASVIPPCGLTSFEGEVEDYLIEISKPPCKAPLNAGTSYISDSLLCPGYQVTLWNKGHTNLNDYLGLSTAWQISTDNGLTWNNLLGSNDLDTFNYIVTAPSRFRLVIMCSSGDTSYSNQLVLNMVPASACYPASGATGNKLDSCDLGFFTIGNYSFSSAGATGPHLGNPAAIRKFTQYANASDIIRLYTDSTYKVSFYSILRSYIHADAKITMFIDYNNNKIYDVPNERIYTGISGPTSFYLPMSFKTISNPVLNTPTGMRVIINNNVNPNSPSDNGVGLYTSGETEDFQVLFVKNPTALNELENSLVNLDMYPNPTNGKLNIELVAKDILELNVTVHSITGAEMASTSYKNIDGAFSTTIDLSDLPKGIYTVKLSSEKGNLVRRIVLE